MIRFFGLSILLHGLLLALVVFFFLKTPVIDDVVGTEVVWIEGVSVGVNQKETAAPKTQTQTVLKKEILAVKEQSSGTSIFGQIGQTGHEGQNGQAVGDPILTQIRRKILKARLYPLEARKKGWSGTVDLYFVLNPQGGLAEKKVIVSSGVPLLDQAALDTLEKGVPYPLYEGPIQVQLKFDLKDNLSQ